MKVILATSAGFCAGVKIAMRIAIDAARRSGGLRSLGPLIHNEQAVRLLELRGVKVSVEPPHSGETLLVRAHGVSPADRRAWENLGCHLIDATCVHVAGNQRLAAAASAEGKMVVVAGDAGHAEVQAVLGAAGPTARVVADASEVAALPPARQLFLLAQTTFETGAFERIAEAVRRRYPEATVKNTICLATDRRQSEARELATRVDALVVVGGRHSANTQRLAEVGGEMNKPVFLVETAAELDPAAFSGFHTVGVTAGASTPGWITQAVVTELRGMGCVDFGSRLDALLYAVVESRALTALAASGLTLAVQLLAGFAFSPSLALAAGLYVFFAHLINRRVPDDKNLRALSGIDPLYSRHRGTLLALAWAAVALALALAWRGGVFWLFAVAVLAALIHSRLAVETMPFAAKLKGVPGSRAILTSLAWSLAIAGPSALTLSGRPRFGAAILAFVFLLVFGKTLIRDLYDLDSDHLMGLETLAVAFGAGRIAKLATLILCSAALIPFLYGVWILFWERGGYAFVVFAFGLSALAGSGSLLIKAGGRRAIVDPVCFQAVLEGIGIAIGILAWICGAWR